MNHDSQSRRTCRRHPPHLAHASKFGAGLELTPWWLVALVAALVAVAAASVAKSAAEAPPEEFVSPRTASFGVFEVEASGINGNVQITELADGGTRFVISLFGELEENEIYVPVLYEGDCGPDRPEVRQLTPVGELPDDPFVSITDTELGFDMLADGDYFVQVYLGEAPGPIVACGEFGVDAIR